MLTPQIILNQTNPFSSKSSLFPLPISFASSNLNDQKRDNCTRKNKQAACRVHCCSREESSKRKAVASHNASSIPAPHSASVNGKVTKITATVVVQISDEGWSDYVWSKAIVVELVAAEKFSDGASKDTIVGKAYREGQENETDIRYQCGLNVGEEFGEIGGIIIENKHNSEMYVKRIYLDGFLDGRIIVSCKSYVQPSTDDEPVKRIFFANKSYLPSETPSGLIDYRTDELSALKGDGKGERMYGDRIYDYDVYNDLGDPDRYPDPAKNKHLKRQVMGGSSEFPYPRRCRTGRPRCKNDKASESLSKTNFYVPRDEHFSEVKFKDYVSNLKTSLRHVVVPTLENLMLDRRLGFPYFTAIDELFNEDDDLPKQFEEQLQRHLPKVYNFITKGTRSILRFKTPQLLNRDKFVWIKDEEFGRQTLAGTNPCTIQLVKEWPLKSKLDPAEYGSTTSLITKELVELLMPGRSTIEEAIEAKRLFVIDYHDLLLPFVHKVRDREGSNFYGARALFTRTPLDTLKPIAIELVRPKGRGKPVWKEVYFPGWDATSGWLWKLAKAQFLAIDSGFHQLYSHWLRTHCVVETYVIATNRQLSAMHPIYRLIKPHLRYTMEINSLARKSLINADGIIESTFSPGHYSIEISSAAYRDMWRFDQEGLPADLIRRGMAEEDPTSPTGVKLTIEDYPYASDGLLLWTIIKQWVTGYVNHYYPDTSHLKSDKEINDWWTEIRTVGHADKKDETWWPKLDSPNDLIEILVTIIWVASGHHAAVNFGQYDFAAYFPNRPSITRTKMPTEDKTDESWNSFMLRPEDEIMSCYPTPAQAAKVLATLCVLSNHSPDEEYIGQKPEVSWLEEPVIKREFELFQNRLVELDGIIDAKNSNKKLRNRTGAGVMPYQFLKPTSEQGVTGRGVPNSVSI